MISEIGKNIKIIRTAKNMSAYELAKRANVGSATISQIESGKRSTLKSDTLNKIAKALKVSVNDIIEMKENINVETNDIMDILDIIRNADFLELDNIKLSLEEKQMFNVSVLMALNSIRYNRLKKR